MEDTDPSLLGLPTELQIHIAEWLLRDNQSRNAILHLRTTCKELHAVCASNITLLKKRFTKLYLHPTRLLGVLAVCKQVGLAADITEVVVLGRSTVDMPELYAEIDNWSSEYADMDDRFDNRPWPHLLPTKPGDGNILSDAELADLAQHGDHFVDHYRALLDALQSLPSIHKLSYAGGVCGPGLCQVSDAGIARHAREHANWQDMFDHPGQPSFEYGSMTHGWSDTEVLTVLLGGGLLPLREIEILQLPPNAERTKYRRLLPAYSLRIPLGHLQSLVCTVPGHYGWYSYYAKLLNGAVDLKHLKINVSSGIDQWWTDFLSAKVMPDHYFGDEWHLANLPWQLPLGVHLTSVSIIGTSHIPDAFISIRTLDLLRQCKDTLRDLSFKNVFFSGLSNEIEDIDLKGATRVILRTIKDMKIQQPTFIGEWTIRRLHCVPDCRVLSGSDPDEHEVACEGYSPPQTDVDGGDLIYYWPFAEPDFVALAMEFGAPEEDDGWNFAKADMLVGLPDE
ncbi:hypothetical protein LTS10_010465 [Elasticomyces elasticus]|nr:hypothetical protein LTS10_010465 [Elasticomyces elasticus]